MTEPLNYLSVRRQPPARWSLCAVVGFVLSLLGPVFGYLLARIVGTASSNDDTLLRIAAVGPLLTGFVLSIIGAVITADGSPPIRGRGLALAGAAIAGLWAILALLLVVMSILNWDGPWL